jgi:nucleoside-diphosphate-sugar epimerase
MERVLVTGSTGFIGVELVRRLTDMGIRPRLLIRRPHRAALLSSLDVEPVYGDLAHPASLTRAVEGVDTIFHLGGRASFESYKRLKPTIVDGSEALAHLAADAGVEQFIFASSLFVYGNQTGPITADTPPTPEIGYGVAKLEAEQRLGSVSAASGMRLANVRLPHVYGPQSILFQQVRRGFAIFPGGMANRCGQLHVEDAARILISIGRHGWIGSSPVADDEIITWTDYFAVLRDLYAPLRLLTLPKWIGYSGAAMLEPLASREGRPTLYTKDTVVGFNLEVPVEPGLIWRDLDVTPKYPTVRQGIPATLDGYVHFRWRHPMLDRRTS